MAHYDFKKVTQNNNTEADITEQHKINRTLTKFQWWFVFISKREDSRPRMLEMLHCVSLGPLYLHLLSM